MMRWYRYQPVIIGKTIKLSKGFTISISNRCYTLTTPNGVVKLVSDVSHNLPKNEVKLADYIISLLYSNGFGVLISSSKFIHHDNFIAITEKSYLVKSVLSNQVVIHQSIETNHITWDNSHVIGINKSNNWRDREISNKDISKTVILPHTPFINGSQNTLILTTKDQLQRWCCGN